MSLDVCQHERSTRHPESSRVKLADGEGSHLKFYLLLLVLSTLPIGCKQQPVLLSSAVTPYVHRELGNLPTPPGQKKIEDGQVVSMIQESGNVLEAKIKVPTDMGIGEAGGADRICRLREGTVVHVSAIVQITTGERLAIVRIVDPCVKQGEAASDLNSVFEGYVRLDDISFDGYDNPTPAVNEQDISQVRTPPVQVVSLEQIKKKTAEVFQSKPLTSTVVASSIQGTTSTSPSNTVENPIIEKMISEFHKKSNDALEISERGCLGLSQATSEVLATRCTSNNSGQSLQMSNCTIGGESFRLGGANLRLVIFGRAEKWRITPSKIGSSENKRATDGTCFGDPTCKNNHTMTNMGSKTVPAVSRDMRLYGVNFVPWSDFVVKPNNWNTVHTDGGSRYRITVQGLSNGGSRIGEQCVHEFSLVSPIVLDLSTSQRAVRTLDGLGQKVKFDLNADGLKESSGWIYPYMGLLTLDRNQNGKIDNGSELFGEHTDGKSFKNGYNAMASLDSDLNQVLDGRDRDFAKLSIWVDADMDGETQSGELRPLSFYNITSLSLDYSALPVNASQLNQVRYQAKFFGPSFCPKAGCNSYDIFFGVDNAVIQAEN